MHYAVYKEQLEVVKACIKMGANGAIKNDVNFHQTHPSPFLIQYIDISYLYLWIFFREIGFWR